MQKITDPGLSGSTFRREDYQMLHDETRTIVYPIQLEMKQKDLKAMLSR